MPGRPQKPFQRPQCAALARANATDTRAASAPSRLDARARAQYARHRNRLAEKWPAGRGK